MIVMTVIENDGMMQGCEGRCNFVDMLQGMSSLQSLNLTFTDVDDEVLQTISQVSHIC